MSIKVTHFESKEVFFSSKLEADCLIIEQEHIHEKYCDGNLVKSIEQIIIVLNSTEAIGHVKIAEDN